MFRRALAKFCLPCGGETVADDVSEFDPDTVYFVPKDFHVVKARLRAQRHEEFVSRLEAHFLKVEQPAASGDVTAPDQAAPLQDSQEEGRSTQEEPHQEGDVPQEPQQTGPSVQESQVEEVQSPEESTRQEGVTAEVSSGSECELPPPGRRPRVCRQCWQRRATLRPRRRLFYPHSLH